MPRKAKSRGSKRQQSPEARQKTRLRGLERLKAQGLYRGDTSRVTSHGAKVLRRYADVLAGKARVMELRSTAASRPYRGTFRVHGKRVVVAKQKGERIYATKDGKLFSTKRDATGKRIRRRILPNVGALSREGALPTGPGIFYAVPMGSPGNYLKFSTPGEMYRRMPESTEVRRVHDKYGTRFTSFTDWEDYIEIWEDLDE